jgi:RNA polymerase sigma-70 factor (ECF subfamily)
MTRHAVRDSAVATLDDDAFTAAVRAGRPEAFEALVRRHGHELRVHCFRMLGSDADAEDLVQETFLRAWHGAARFESRASLRTWLYRIATNACLDALRRRTRMPVTAVGGAPGGGTGDGSAESRPGDARRGADRPGRAARAYASEAAPAEDEPDAAVVAREAVLAALLAVIEVLPAQQRAVLILRDVFGWSAAESAVLLGTSVPAVNSALQRARAALRDRRAQGLAPPRPSRPPETATATSATAAPAHRPRRALLRCLVDAHEQADGAAVAVLARAVDR